MMTPDAMIIVNVTPTDWGYFTHSYSWEGCDVAEMHFTDVLRSIPEHLRKRPWPVFYLGQLRLRVVRDDLSGWVYVMRDGWKARLYAFLFPAKDLLTKIYHRLILTAFVWGLADHDWAAVPTWRDMKALRWIAQKVKR